MSTTNQKWIAIDGSLYVDKVDKKFNRDFKVNYTAREAIAFNVGQETAEYIAMVHNSFLEKKQLLGVNDATNS